MSSAGFWIESQRLLEGLFCSFGVAFTELQYAPGKYHGGSLAHLGRELLQKQPRLVQVGSRRDRLGQQHRRLRVSWIFVQDEIDLLARFLSFAGGQVEGRHLDTQFQVVRAQLTRL